ncbi:anti-sigma factor RsbA family regulatory protein [Actinokineospora sp.]|uniref:anti-sigma factor RsbA family regulatory protein n=1 Tax=Actinokineospora sp. TaxID=1872133 RepID=UPI00403836B2
MTVEDRHTAVLYRGVVEYLAAVVPFVRDGVAAGVPVTVAAPTANLGLLRAECAAGGLADRVRWLDVGEVGRNPGRIVPAVLHPLFGGPARVVTEVVWPGRPAAEYRSCVRHEALANRVLAGRAVRVLCPYDAQELSPVELADAAVTHPALLERGERRPSAGYAPQTVLDAYNTALPPPDDALIWHVGAGELSAARRMATGHARRLGFGDDRLADIALVVSELVTNSIEHGAGRARLRTWTSGTEFVCEVFDEGRFPDPLAGLWPASPYQPHGRGLQLVNSLADLVTSQCDEHGTAIRAHFARG